MGRITNSENQKLGNKCDNEKKYPLIANKFLIIDKKNRIFEEEKEVKPKEFKPLSEMNNKLGSECLQESKGLLKFNLFSESREIF